MVWHNLCGCAFRIYAVVVGATGVEVLSFMNSTTKRVIHQKKRLIRKKSQKLRPLLLAINAGQRATMTQIIAIKVSQIALSVTPIIVVANIIFPFSYVCVHCVT